MCRLTLVHLYFVPVTILVDVFPEPDAPAPNIQRAFPGNAYHYPPDQRSEVAADLVHYGNVANADEWGKLKVA